jgi:hypothetical protein
LTSVLDNEPELHDGETLTLHDHCGALVDTWVSCRGIRSLTHRKKAPCKLKLWTTSDSLVTF